MAAKFPTGSTKAESLFIQAEKDLRELEDDYKTATTGKKDSKPAGKSKGKAAASSKPASNPPRNSTRPKPKPKPHNNISSEFEKKEYFDTEEVLAEKTDQLVQWIRESRYCIAFTGAGISTSTGIPDFRSGINTVLPTGPGVWERKAKGVQLPSQPKKTKSILGAVPSPSHMALLRLQQEGLIKFVVSQNTDGLHRRSGVNPKLLAELHGNTNMEKCLKCGVKYMRDFRTRTSRAVHDHLTGRRCDNPKCGGPLVDSIINFNEDLPEDELQKGFENAELADLCIVLGSSLRVYPAADIPDGMIRRGARVVIVNLQKTPLNKCCAMEIHARIDTLMESIMKRFGLEIPQFQLKRYLAIEVTSESLTIQGLDPVTKTPYSFMKSVKVDLPSLRSEHDLTKEPFYVKFPSHMSPSEGNALTVDVTLAFQGHYGEPEITIKHVVSKLGSTIFMLKFDVATGEWKIEKQ